MDFTIEYPLLKPKHPLALNAVTVSIPSRDTGIPGKISATTLHPETILNLAIIAKCYDLDRVADILNVG
jgi:hypothetical protein